jgi:hypothetical protein
MRRGAGTAGSSRPAARSPRAVTPDPSSTDLARLPKFHGQFAPLQVTPDQFLAAAQSGQMETAVTTMKSLLDALH